MRILVSNDDGYQAPGLAALVNALRAIGEVTVVAPDRDRSGASNSLTLGRPLRVVEHDNGFYSVDGTPTDCVHVALFGLLDEEPDVVVSGINAGANLGDDVIYSGTVAAAMEGRFLGLPSVAVSLVGEEPRRYDVAAGYAAQLTASLATLAMPAGTLLNVNVPGNSEPGPIRAELTRLGQRHKAEPVIKDTDPRGRTIYWIGATGPELDAGAGTDFDAVRRGLVSVTVVSTDLTCAQDTTAVNDWLLGLERP